MRDSASLLLASGLVLACQAEVPATALPWPTDSEYAPSSGASTGHTGDEGEAETGESSGSTGAETPTTSPSSEGSSSGDIAPGTDFPEIARVQVPASWVAADPEIWTYDFEADVPPDYDIARAFFADNPDDYDFLAVYTEGEFEEFGAHAVVVHEDLSGIRFGDEQPWSQAAQAGSAGRLQQINLMNSPRVYWDPGAADILIHETAHRWSAFLGLLGAPAPDALLGPAGGHWNIHVHTGGPSATGYGDLYDLGGGNFRFEVIYPLRLSPLELYVAGLIPAAELPPLFYVANPSNHDPAVNQWGEPLDEHAYGEDATFQGTRVDFTVEEIAAANGPRLPAFGDAQTHFRVAFVLVCLDVTQCDTEDLALVEQQRAGFATQFPAATGDRATVDTTL